MTNEKGETYFVGKDVAEALGYKKPENALATHVDREDKTTTLIQGNGSKYKSQTITIDDVGTFKPVLRTQDGVRVTIQFRPKPQLVHRLEDTRQYVERHVKTSDGTYTKYDGRIVERYRWKKEDVRCKRAEG